MVLTSRVSCEMVQKVMRLNTEILIGVSSATSFAGGSGSGSQYYAHRILEKREGYHLYLFGTDTPELIVIGKR